MGTDMTVLNELKNRIHNSDIASIKSVLMDLIQLINDPSSSAKQLKDIIEIDPPLSMRILRLANSAYFGLSRKISDIQEAIIWIGFDAVKQIALSMKILELFVGDVNQQIFSRTELWKHSAFSAVIGKMIYRREFKDIGNNIYCLGLLHNIGIIMFDQFKPLEFRKIMEAYLNDGDSLNALEFGTFGFDHSVLASEMMREWNLPENMYVPVLYHHHPFDAPEKYRKEAMVLWLTDQICLMNDIGFNDANQVNEEEFKTVLELLNIEHQALENVLESGLQEMNKMEQMGWF